MVAPTGVALAQQPEEVAPESAYSAALGDTQNLTVTAEGAAIAPVQRGTFSVYVTPKPTPTPTPTTASEGSSGSSKPGPSAVSYTHLTLPTIYSV